MKATPWSKNYQGRRTGKKSPRVRVLLLCQGCWPCQSPTLLSVDTKWIKDALQALLKDLVMKLDWSCQIKSNKPGVEINSELNAAWFSSQTNGLVWQATTDTSFLSHTPLDRGSFMLLGNTNWLCQGSHARTRAHRNTLWVEFTGECFGEGRNRGEALRNFMGPSQDLQGRVKAALQGHKDLQ